MHVVEAVDGFDDGVEAAAVEHRALAPHGVRVDVEQPRHLGVARPAAAVPRPGTDLDLAVVRPWW